ncbi:2Fe-2S iron-sulfur cluster-binding protein [Streptomyces sp. NPDC012637]|uniref:2Fe-2S iron-sulfur cluster-binding protein n=1 Tax=Streptomyces sp. NPDC012637 TaxID=3364842 RepID=UPI0036EF2197
MSDEAQGNHGNHGSGGWEPIPQSEGYDGDATAFVQLPPDFMLDGIPLEAPGHGYVPPMIVPLTPLAATDPAATGTWAVQPPVAPEHVQEHVQGHLPEYAQDGGYEAPVADVPMGEAPGYEPAPAYEPAQGSTGQWTIPTVEDGADGLDDSGEYTASRLAQYASGAPATLPGGAPAPWAVTEPEPEPVTEEAAEPGPVPATEPVPATGPVSATGPVPESVPEAEPVPVPEPVSAPERGEGEPELAFPQEPLDAFTPAADISDISGITDVADVADATGHADVAVHADSGDSRDSDEHPTTAYTLRVNGVDRPVTDSWIGESLLYVLRERLGLAGAKDGCSQGECGACNVQVDGRLVASCLVPAATAAGSEVRTVEGLAVDGEPSDVQRALAKCGVQCGFCIPGMAMTVHDLLEGNHAPTELETRQALCGNLCRCSGYRGVLDAVNEIVAGREAAAESGPSASAPDENTARIPHQIPHPHDGGTA